MSNPTPPPTLQEQAVIDVWDKAVEYCNKNCRGGDHTYSVAHAAFIAGHAQASGEVAKLEGIIKENARIMEAVSSDVQDLKKENEQLFKDERELLAQISTLRSKLQVADIALSKIEQMSDPGSPERFIIEAKKIAGEARKQIQEK
jgi:hypothetical protein